MKKIVALLLAAVMLMSVCSVFAEAAEKTIVPYDEKLSFAFALPEGYEMEYCVVDGIMLAHIQSADEAKPGFTIVIGQCEEHEDLPRLNDLDEAEKAQLVADLCEDLNNPTTQILTTGYGTEVIVIDDQDAEYDLATLTSLYYGCVITMYVGHVDGSAVTEADLAVAMQIMTDLDFVVAE